jgi:Icc protein
MSDAANITPSNLCPETPAAIRILHITDFHFLAEPGATMLGVDTEETFGQVLNAALRGGKRPDLGLLTGDLVQDATIATYRRVRERLLGLDFPCYCLPGNHDEPRMMAEVMAGGNVFCQPRILVGNWHIICLDSTIPRSPEGRLDEDQLKLLETLLREQPERHTLVTLHHHPVPSGSQWMDTMLAENADRMFAILKQHKQVRGVVFGHVHQAMDLRYENLRLLATPSTCFQFKPHQADFALDALPAGYRWIELHPDGRMETTVERLAEVPAGLDFNSQGY